MRLPEGALGFCGVTVGVVGFDTVCVGFGVGVVQPTAKNKCHNFSFL